MRRIPIVLGAVMLALTLLVAGLRLSDRGSKAEEDVATRPRSGEDAGDLPPIDVAQHAETATATFGLG